MSAHYSYLGISYRINVSFSWFSACIEITGTYGRKFDEQENEPYVRTKLD